MEFTAHTTMNRKMIWELILNQAAASKTISTSETVTVSTEIVSETTFTTVPQQTSSDHEVFRPTDDYS